MATLVGDGVATVAVTAPGTGYTSAPTVRFTGGGGSGATATATVAGGGVTAVAVTAPGTGYTSPPTVVLTDPSNKTALDALAKQISQDFYDFRSWSLDIVYNGIAAVEPNALYDCVEFRYDAVDCWTRVTSQPWNGEPQEYQHFDPETADCSDANNFNQPTEKVPYIEVFGGPESCTGGRALAVAVVTGDAVTAVNMLTGVIGIGITSGGTGYTSVPTVAITGGGGFGATATVTISGGMIATITITNPGTGYTSAPSIGLTGGGGASATFLAVISDNGGYISLPQVAFSHVPGDGTGAKATAILVGGVITAVNVDAGGSGYTAANPPLVSFYGGGISLQRTVLLIGIEDGRLVNFFSHYLTVG
jgi:hypothetical protein